MTLRTLLVQAEATEDGLQCLSYAAALAVDHGAHLIGVAAVNAVAMAADWSHALAPSHTDLAQHALHTRARRAAAWFEQEARSAGVQSFESRIEVRDVAEATAMHARYSDLVVLPLPDPQSWIEERSTQMVEHVLQRAGRPLLLIPRGRVLSAQGDGIAVVAWDASREAARAVADALPLLQRARHVHVLQVLARAEEIAQPDGVAMLVSWLERHRIDAQAMRPRQHGSVAETLMRHAQASGAELLVAGGYGDSPLKEAFTRGVTRTLLRHAALPLLLSH